MITLTSHRCCPLFLLSLLFCLHFTVSLPLCLPLFLSYSSFPKDRLSFPCPFLWISPSFIVHYSNFSEQRNEAWAPSSFQDQNAGSVRLLHTRRWTFFHLHIISVLLKTDGGYITSLHPSCDSDFSFCPVFILCALTSSYIPSLYT